MDSWVLVQDGYDPADEGRREALCTLGNGFFATRGAAPEATADEVHYPGTYAAGVYNRLADEVDGVPVENESLVNLPSWLPVRFAANAHWFDLDRTELLSYRQELDLREGLLVRTLRFRDPAGRVTAAVQRRFVHMGVPHLAGLETTLTAENWSGRLRVRSSIDPDVRNTGVARYRQLSGRHLTRVDRRLAGDRALVVAETSQSRVRVATAIRTRARTTGAGAVHLHPVDRPGELGHEVALEVVPGDTVTVEKLAWLHTSRDSGISEPGASALTELAHAEDFDTALESHRLAWDSLWRLFGVEVRDGQDLLPPDLLLGVRLGLFHLLQTVSPHVRALDVGVPARGLHGEAYRGHVFWDEMFVTPVLGLRLPGVARALLVYRHRRLPAARRAARTVGCRGALFPWQSGSDGREESQRLHLNPASGRWLEDTTYLQRHAGLAVAFSAWRLFETTGDLELLGDYGAELILEIARFFADLVRFDEARGRYVLTGVVGPDEYHTAYPGADHPGIDNNAYTNVMTAWLMRTATRVLAVLPPVRRAELVRALHLTPADLARWKDVAALMFVPFHDGMISQFEGYERLAELDWDGYRAKYGDISRLDRILEAEGSSVNEVQASKQADVLMLFYLLSADDLDGLLRGLGYELDRARIPATIDYYLSRTCHGSTLSSVVHAWVLARAHRDQALPLLAEVVHSDVVDTHGGTTPEGVHLAAMVGGADLLQRCFAGVEPRLEELRFSPYWPASLGELSFVVRYQCHELAVTISAEALRVTSQPGTASPVLVGCAGTAHQLYPGQTLLLDPVDGSRLDLLG